MLLQLVRKTSGNALPDVSALLNDAVVAADATVAVPLHQPVLSLAAIDDAKAS